MKSKKIFDPYDVKLDPYEQELEDSLDFKKMKRAKNSKDMIVKLQEAAANFRKQRQINELNEAIDVGLKNIEQG